MWHCPHSPAARLLLTAGRAAVDDISYPTSSQQQTHHSAYGSRMEQTDRRTDARELQMQRACSVYYAGSAKRTQYYYIERINKNHAGICD